MSEEEKLQLENECLLKYSKAQMIQKYIDELEENCVLSDLWCKSQEENKQLHTIIKEVRELLKNDYFEDGSFTSYKKVFELLDKESK